MLKKAALVVATLGGGVLFGGCCLPGLPCLNCEFLGPLMAGLVLQNTSCLSLGSLLGAS